jgi:hypothetical protein
MLWLTGADRYLAATVELYESTVRATTLFGGGWTRNVGGLGEAFLIGVGVFLPVLAWGLWRGPVRLVQGSDRAVFFALWTLPALVVYTVVHLGQHGYLLTVLPACYLVVGRSLVALWQRLQEVRMPAAGRGALAGLALAGRRSGRTWRSSPARARWTRRARPPPRRGGPA